MSIIKTENIFKYYNKGKANEICAIKNISLNIPENKCAVFFGPSGSGKTTLLSLIGAIDRPNEGRIFIDGKDITDFSDLEFSRIRRYTIGFVFQNFNQFSGLSAWENVSYPLIPIGISKKNRFERAKMILSRLGLANRINHTPETLSSGQQQRVAIARALVNDPKILIADEPTSNIDSESVDNLLNILTEFKNQGKTIIISSHDPKFKSYGDLLFNIEQGCLK